MTSNVNISDMCLNESETHIKLLATNDTHLSNNSSLINLPLITSESSKLNQISTNILITSDPLSGTTILQIDPSNQLSLFQTSSNINETFLPPTLLDVSNELSHYVIQTDSIIQNQLEFNNSNDNELNQNYCNQVLIPISNKNENYTNNQINSKIYNKNVSTKKSSSPQLTTEITPVFVDNKEEEAINESESENYIKTNNGLYECKICSLQLNKLNQMRKHFKCHTEDKPFKCDECVLTFNFEVNLRLHRSTVHYNSNLTTKPSCSECTKCFTRLASLKSHVLIHQKDEMLSCVQCSEEFISHYYLKKHINSIHVPKKLPKLEKQQMSTKKQNYIKDGFHCSICYQKFNNICNLREHTKLHVQIKSSLKHRTYRKGVDRTGFNHECNTCGKTFKKNSQLIRHIRIHTGEKPFVCEFCNKAFNQKNSLDIHKTKHTGERKFKCKFCSAMFNQSGNMRSHIKRLHAPQADIPASQLHKCPFCNCVFKKVGILNCHISRRHSSEANNNFMSIQTNSSANNCLRPINDSNKSIINEIKSRNINIITESLNSNVETADNFSDLLSKALENSGVTSLNEQLANSCDKEIAQLFDPATGTRQTHIVRRVGKISYRQCLYCQKEFKKSSDLVRHVRIHTHDKPFKCSQCYRAFTVKGTLSAHMRTHDGIKPYVCQVCNKSFSTSQSLKVHTRLHTGATPYPCTQCEKMFRTLGHLKSHLATHQRQAQSAINNALNNSNSRFNKSHKIKNIDECLLSKIQLEGPIMVVNANDQNNDCITGDNNLSTNLTTIMSQTKQYMNQTVEPESEVDHLGRPKRKYQCSHCEKAFKKSSHLTQHIRSHTGEKPFQCDICTQCFVAKGSLKIHLQVHSGIKPFKCSECSFAFSTRGSLTRHMARHRDVRPFMCPYCQKTFKSSLNCKKHIKLHRTEFALQLLKEQQNTDTFDNTAIGQMSEQQINTSISPLEISSENINSIEQTEPGITSIHQTVDEIPLMPLNVNNNTILSDAVNIESGIHSTLPSEQTTYYEIKDSHKYFEPSLTLPVHITTDSVLESQASISPLTRPTTVFTAANNSMKDQRPYPCETCGNAFKKSSHLKQHIRRHTGEKPFQCEICLRAFATRGVLNTHINTHSSVKNYRCDVCSATFVTNNSLRRHVNTIHEMNAFHCPHCSCQLKSEFALAKHIKSSHENSIIDKSLFQQTMPSTEFQINSVNILELCEETSVPFVKQSTQQKDNNQLVIFEANNHLSETENNNKLDLMNSRPRVSYSNQCDFCPKSFKKPSDLARHRRIHTGEKPFVCDICKKRFTVKSTLDSHLITHKGEKNFKCDVCSACFATNGSLKVHMRLHTGSKPFKCTQCDARFRTSGHRKAHIDKHNKNKIKSIPPLNQLQVMDKIDLTQDMAAVNDCNQTLGNEVMRIALSANLNQTVNTSNNYHIDAALLTQLFQMDSTLIQQLQSQGIIITSDAEDITLRSTNNNDVTQIF